MAGRPAHKRNTTTQTPRHPRDLPLRRGGPSGRTPTDQTAPNEGNARQNTQQRRPSGEDKPNPTESKESSRQAKTSLDRVILRGPGLQFVFTCCVELVGTSLEG